MEGKEFNKKRKKCPHYKFISPGPAMQKQHLCFIGVGKNDGEWQAKPCSFRKCGFVYWWGVFNNKIDKVLTNL